MLLDGRLTRCSALPTAATGVRGQGRAGRASAGEGLRYQQSGCSGRIDSNGALFSRAVCVDAVASCRPVLHYVMELTHFGGGPVPHPDLSWRAWVASASTLSLHSGWLLGLNTSAIFPLQDTANSTRHPSRSLSESLRKWANESPPPENLTQSNNGRRQQF